MPDSLISSDPHGLIDRVMLKDRFALRKAQQRLQRLNRDDRDYHQLHATWSDRLMASQREVLRRTDRLPEIAFDADLPILAHRTSITAALLEHQVLVVAGETGSGKSTQLPKICLAAGFGVRGMIGHTQPRRIAARSIAARLAVELRTPLGQDVGYQVRFHDQTSDNTYIKLMTDGILLAETQNDRFLQRYEVIILDEAHERSLNIDFLLGYLQRTLRQRSELRLLVTSATIDAERFGKFFDDAGITAPVIQVSGRNYPVEIQYQPLTRMDEQEDRAVADGIVQAVHQLAALDGDVLVFLPTERDIRETSKRLRAELHTSHRGSTMEIVPLYARLSTAEQQRVFQPGTKRRIVLATNVAESSLTVPGIRYVIDTGTARISRYNPRSKVQRLPIEAVSRASADQRAGRCGRLAPGICVRLYEENDYAARPEFTTPEIQRTNLASVILQAKAMQLGEVDQFPFLDPPRKETIQDGYRTLFEIGALDEQRELTALGRAMSRLPIDPRLARLVLAGRDHDCIAEILVLAAALEIQDPRERPLDKQQLADECHARFRDDRSDFLTLLRLWDFYHDLKRRLSRSQLRRACSQNFLSFARLREWTETHRQLVALERAMPSRLRKTPRLKRSRPRVDSSEPKTASTELGELNQDRFFAVHQALMTGFLSGIAMRRTAVEYTGAGGVPFFLWPGSGLFQRKPQWCLIAELVETSRRYGRIIAEIKPEWVEPLALHLVKRSYHDPHWHRRRCEAMAFERVTLFGLPIVGRRRVSFGQLDPAVARELFLKDGLKHDQPWAADQAMTDMWESPTKSKRRTRRVAEAASALQRLTRHQQARAKKTMMRTDRLAAQPFFRHNQRILDQAARIAAKSRRSDAMIDDFTIYRFYASRMPADIIDLKSLQAWTKANPQDTQRLQMKLEEFLAIGSRDAIDQQFPDRLQIERLELPLKYHFAPGQLNDGVTVVVPEEGLRQLHSGRTGWLVPGLVQEKIETLIRSLPKNLRTNFIPVPDVARRVVTNLQFGEGSFLTQMVQQLNAISSDVIREDDFDLSRLPSHLQMNIEVVAADGKTKAQGRDPLVLASKLGVLDAPALKSGGELAWHRDDVRQWDFGDVPAELSLVRAGIRIVAFPTIVDAGDSVQLRVYDRQLDASRALRTGVRRLYALEHRRAVRSQLTWLPDWNAWSVLAAPLQTADQLRSQVGDLLVDLAFLGLEAPPRTQQGFAERAANATERLSLATQDIARFLPKLFRAYHDTRLRLEQRGRTNGDEVADDVRHQLSYLFVDHFLLDTPWAWLQEFPRYLRAICYRLDRSAGRLTERDRSAIEELREFWQEYQQRSQACEDAGQENVELSTFRWMLEEYRVSLFAQQLGTRFSVSVNRLRKQLAKSR